MKTAEEIFETQAFFNKWLRELSDTEKNHILYMMEEYANQPPVTEEEIESVIKEFIKYWTPPAMVEIEEGSFEKDIRRLINLNQPT